MQLISPHSLDKSGITDRRALMHSNKKRAHALKDSLSFPAFVCFGREAVFPLAPPVHVVCCHGKKGNTAQTGLISPPTHLTPIYVTSLVATSTPRVDVDLDILVRTL